MADAQPRKELFRLEIDVEPADLIAYAELMFGEKPYNYDAAKLAVRGWLEGYLELLIADAVREAQEVDAESD